MLTDEPLLTDELRARFWAKVEVRGDDECWPWTAATDPNGYGNCYIGTLEGRPKYRNAHRVAYMLTHGAIPPVLVVCHDCDNPPCCNPEHLFADTQIGNLEDMTSKGRRRYRAHPGEENGRAKLTRQDVRFIRGRRMGGESVATLARCYGVGWDAVNRICKGRSWRDPRTQVVPIITEADRSSTCLLLPSEY